MDEITWLRGLEVELRLEGQDAAAQGDRPTSKIFERFCNAINRRVERIQVQAAQAEELRLAGQD